jgi:type II secretory pathway component PulJ
MTLIELVAAIVIMAVMFLALMKMFSTTVLSREKIEDRLGTLEAATGVMDLLAHDLEQIHVYDSRTYFMLNQQDITGGKITSIAFPCLSPMRVSDDLRQNPGLIEVAYLASQDKKNPNLVVVQRREMPIETSMAAKTIRDSEQGLVLLADSLTQFSIDFLPPPAPVASGTASTSTDFTDQWTGGFGADKIPVAIRIQLTGGGINGSPPFSLERIIRMPELSVQTEMLNTTLTSALAAQGITVDTSGLAGSCLVNGNGAGGGQPGMGGTSRPSGTSGPSGLGGPGRTGGPSGPSGTGGGSPSGGGGRPSGR